MKTKKKLVSLAVSALLTVVIGESAYAGSCRDNDQITVCHAGKLVTCDKKQNHTANHQGSGTLHTVTTGTGLMRDVQDACPAKVLICHAGSTEITDFKSLHTTDHTETGTLETVNGVQDTLGHCPVATVGGASATSITPNNQWRGTYATTPTCTTGCNAAGYKSDGTQDTELSLTAHPERHYADSDRRRGDSGAEPTRGPNDSLTDPKLKVSVCHVPKGNPSNRHTIHISYGAWVKAHRFHNATSAPGDSDQLGSCNTQKTVTTIKSYDPTTGTPVATVAVTNPPTTASAPKAAHTITGCVGSYHKALMTKIQSYYDPITVDDAVLDGSLVTGSVTPNLTTGISQCLDNGDSSDSTKAKVGTAHPDSSNTKDANNRKVGGKGQGHDSVSDSRQAHTAGETGHKIHQIRGCKNQSTTHVSDSTHGHKDDSQGTHNKHGLTDSDKTLQTGSTTKYVNDSNFHKLLKDADSLNDSSHHKNIKDRLAVSDSARHDSGVWNKVKTCAGKSTDATKIDSSKVGHHEGGDSGHKHMIVKGCTSGTDNDNLRAAVITHKAAVHNNANAPIVITDDAYADNSIQAAVADCLDPTKGKGTDSFLPSSTVTSATVSNATITGATVTGATIAPPATVTATNPTTTTTGGVINGGTVTTTSSDPTITKTVNGVVTTTGGTVSLGSTGTISYGVTTGGTVTAGTVISGSITQGTISSGASSSGNVVNKSVTNGTLSSGTVSGGTITNGTDVGGTVTGGTGVATTPASTTTAGVTTTTPSTMVTTGGTVSGGTTTGSGATAVTTGGTVSGGTTSGAVVTGGTATGATITGATDTGASISNGTITNTTTYSSGGSTAPGGGGGGGGSGNTPAGGSSGRVNWRQINN